MAKKVCPTPGCPAIIDRTQTRCPDCAREHERRRGTRQQRGYDAEHQAARARWAPRVATGDVPCRRCRVRIRPDEPWDLGHPDAECPAPRAPEHRDRCNRAAAGRSAHPQKRT